MTEDAKKLGANLKKIRLEKNITQAQIAKALSADRSSVGNSENGKINPTLSIITNLAKALSITVAELLK